MKSDDIEQQAKPLRDLIDYARERDVLGKANATRLQLINALMILGRGRKEAEREIDNARVRVRKVADKVEMILERRLLDEGLWRWTHPRSAVLEMRRRVLEPYDYEGLPFTEIEEDLARNANALLIIAVYPALRNAISRQLTKLRVESASTSSAPGG